MNIVRLSPHAHAGFTPLLAIHVAAAAIWVGGGVALVALSELYRARGESPGGLELIAAVRRYVFLPAGILVFACGLGLLAIGDISPGRGWVIVALCGWAISFSIELVVSASDPLASVVDADVASTRRARHATRALYLSRLQALVLLLVLVDMVVRPSL